MEIRVTIPAVFASKFHATHKMLLMRKWISISDKKDGLKISYKGADIVLPPEAPIKVCGNCGKLSVGAKGVEDLECAMIEALELAKNIPA